MKIILSILMFFLVYSEAQIGETLEECRKRYGNEKPIGENKLTKSKYYVFKKNGIEILIHIYEDKCQLISFTNLDVEASKKKIAEIIGKPFTELKTELGERGTIVSKDPQYHFYIMEDRFSLATIFYREYFDKVTKRYLARDKEREFSDAIKILKYKKDSSIEELEKKANLQWDKYIKIAEGTKKPDLIQIIKDLREEKPVDKDKVPKSINDFMVKSLQAMNQLEKSYLAQESRLKKQQIAELEKIAKELTQKELAHVLRDINILLNKLKGVKPKKMYERVRDAHIHLKYGTYEDPNTGDKFTLHFNGHLTYTNKAGEEIKSAFIANKDHYYLPVFNEIHIWQMKNGVIEASFYNDVLDLTEKKVSRIYKPKLIKEFETAIGKFQREFFEPGIIEIFKDGTANFKSTLKPNSEIIKGSVKKDGDKLKITWPTYSDTIQFSDGVAIYGTRDNTDKEWSAYRMEVK